MSFGVKQLGSSQVTTTGLDGAQANKGTGEAVGLKPGDKIEASESPKGSQSMDGASTTTGSELKQVDDKSSKVDDKQARKFAEGNKKAADEFKPGKVFDGKGFKKLGDKGDLKSDAMKKAYGKAFDDLVRNDPSFKTGKMSSDALQKHAETAIKSTVDEFKANLNKLADDLKSGTGDAFDKLDGAKDVTSPKQKELMKSFVEKKLANEKGFVDGSLSHDKVNDIAQKAVKHVNSLAKTKLNSDIDEALGKSPTLKNEVVNLMNDGWTVRFTKKGDTQGSYCDRQNTTIVLDKNYKGNLGQNLTTLAHEVGHARYTPDAQPKVDSGLTKTEYRNRCVAIDFKDEGEAALMNCKVKQELANGKPPITIGVAGEKNGNFTDVFNKLERNEIDRDQARVEIGNHFGQLRPSTKPEVNYDQYYGAQYERSWDRANNVAV